MSNEQDTNLSIVVVVDTNSGRASDMQEAFSDTIFQKIHVGFDGNGRIRVYGNDSIPESCSILLWHVGDLGIDETQLANLHTESPKGKIYYSGSGGDDPRFPSNTTERIWRIVSPGEGSNSGVLTSEEADALWQYVCNDAPRPLFLCPSITYLSILNVLCQGCLAVCAVDNPEPQDYSINDALKQMGWEDFQQVDGDGLIRQNLTDPENINTEVFVSGWWCSGLGINPEDNQNSARNVSQAIKAEWENLTGKEDLGDIRLLLEALGLTEDGNENAEIEAGMVARAYNAIASAFNDHYQ